MARSDQYGAFVPNTFIWDVQELKSIDVNSPEFKELLVRLYQNLSLMADVLNIKVTGKYPRAEFVNGKLYFPNPANSSASPALPAERQVRQKLIYYSAPLPNAGTATIPHGITCTTMTTFTRVYATASDTTGLNYIPIPYSSPTLANNIEIRVDSTNVYIITGSNRSNFNITYIVLEYLQT